MTESTPSRAEPAPVNEPRDTERLVALWQQKISGFAGPSPAVLSDLGQMIAEDWGWGYRFLIRANVVGSDLALLMYGSQFARLLKLSKVPDPDIPMARQLPKWYATVFTKGCYGAIVQTMPVRLAGVIVQVGQLELYRAAFVPLVRQANTLDQLVFGTFNRRNWAKGAGIGHVSGDLRSAAQRHST
jgi:hypothetical protein